RYYGANGFRSSVFFDKLFISGFVAAAGKVNLMNGDTLRVEELNALPFFLLNGKPGSPTVHKQTQVDIRTQCKTNIIVERYVFVPALAFMHAIFIAGERHDFPDGTDLFQQF